MWLLVQKKCFAKMPKEIVRKIGTQNFIFPKIQFFFLLKFELKISISLLWESWDFIILSLLLLFLLLFIYSAYFLPPTLFGTLSFISHYTYYGGCAGDTDYVLGVKLSLKEEKALSGRAKDFLSVKKLSGMELGSETKDFTKDEFALIAGKTPITAEIARKYQTQYNASKKAYTDLIKKFGYDNNFATSKFKDPDPNAVIRNIIIKSAIYRLMTRYFTSFDKLKLINDVMKNYKDPFLALTAYGVSLSGFNPTFYKVIASESGDYGHIVTFKGRDSLKAESDSVTTIDTPTKAGIYISFITIMGDTKYQTKLDIRESKSGANISIAIIVDKFHEA